MKTLNILLIAIIGVVFLSCAETAKSDNIDSPQEQLQHQIEEKPVDSIDTLGSAMPAALAGNKNEICWTGSLSGKIPVFIHYQIDNNVIIGEIIYLNTKARLPIRLLGTITENENYELLEFDNKGNITGIITGLPTDRTFKGRWVSPASNKEFSMSLSIADTSMLSPDIEAVDNQIFGNYHYQYGKDGYSGDFEINRVDNDKVDFNILSLTNAEQGPNMAEVEKDTIVLKGNSFVYMIPYSDNCEFKTTFYKDFVYINYTKGYCSGQFGMNATIEGIYLKTK